MAAARPGRQGLWVQHFQAANPGHGAFAGRTDSLKECKCPEAGVEPEECFLNTNISAFLNELRADSRRRPCSPGGSVWSWGLSLKKVSARGLLTPHRQAPTVLQAPRGPREKLCGTCVAESHTRGSRDPRPRPGFVYVRVAEADDHLPKAVSSSSSSLYRWGNGGPGKAGHSPKVIQLVGVGAGIQTRAL